MSVVIEVPEITDNPSGFPQYWLKTMFIGSVSNSYQVNALTSTYIRLVEVALVEYRRGQPRLQEFWNTHHSINLPAMHRAISHFETRLTDMHRAIARFIRLRRHRDLPD